MEEKKDLRLRLDNLFFTLLRIENGLRKVVGGGRRVGVQKKNSARHLKMINALHATIMKMANTAIINFKVFL